jgi:hypothetical protein
MMEDLVSLNELGDHIIARNLAKATKYQYRRMKKYFIKFLKSQYPECVIQNDEDEEDVKLPLADEPAMVQKITKDALTWIIHDATYRDGGRSRATHHQMMDEERSHLLNVEEREEDEFTAATTTGSSFEEPIFEASHLLGISHLKGFNSMLQNLYKSRGVTNTALHVQETFMDGYLRVCADMKQKGTMKIDEGKIAVRLEGYRKLAQLSFSDPAWTQLRWGHLYILLCWNLVARSCTVASIALSHIGWNGDCLTINIPRHKGDQRGKNAFDRSVYANPNDPVMCPVLALAMELVSTGYRQPAPGIIPSRRLDRRGRRGRQNNEDDEDNGIMLFEGKSENNAARFSKWLRLRLRTLSDYELKEMGIAAIAQDLGTHSFRKGAATKLSAQPSGPNPINIFLRAGWSVGKSQDGYFYGGGGGDQLCGRILAGLPFMLRDFGALPPHFDLSKGSLLSDDEWRLIFPGYESYPDKLQEAAKYLLASLTFHEATIEAKVPLNHPIWQSRWWKATEIRTRLKSRSVETGCIFNETTKMEASGSAPHHQLAQAIHNVTMELTNLKELFIATDAAKTHLIEAVSEKIPDEVLERIQRRYTIDGTPIPVSIEQMRSSFQELLEVHMNNLRDEVRQVQQDLSRLEERSSGRVICGVEQQRRANEEYGEGGHLNRNNWPRYTWGGRIGHHVPEGWLFPNTPIKTLFDMWFLGNELLRIGPYRKIEHWDLPPRSRTTTGNKRRRNRQGDHDEESEQSSSDEEESNNLAQNATTSNEEEEEERRKKQQRAIDNAHIFLSNARVVMKRLVEVGVQRRIISAENDVIKETRQVNLDDFFNRTYPIMMQEAYGGGIEGRRIGDLTLVAVYKDIITKRNKRTPKR